MYVPTKNNIKNEIKNRMKKYPKTNKFIAINPGIRTFATGITESTVEKFGNNCVENIDLLIK
jgi:hypothetical protein